MLIPQLYSLCILRLLQCCLVKLTCNRTHIISCNCIGVQDIYTGPQGSEGLFDQGTLNKVSEQVRRTVEEPSYQGADTSLPILCQAPDLNQVRSVVFDTVKLGSRMPGRFRFAPGLNAPSWSVYGNSQLGSQLGNCSTARSIRKSHTHLPFVQAARVRQTI